MGEQPHVLVAYATAHGSTRGVAERLAAGLGGHGNRVELQPVDRVEALDAYDAVVFGSPVYNGLRQVIQPRDYRVFAGAIEQGRWSGVGRLVFKAFGGRFGDNRDWREVDAWADEIAQALEG